jgi:membrane protein DedA with SNARE-associated domain
VDSAVTGFLNLFASFTGVFGYGGIAVVMIVAAPELVMPFAGFLIARGDLGFTGVMLAGVVGAMIGQGGIYWAARRVGERRVRGFFRRHGRWLLVSEGDLDRTLNLFNRFENTVVLFGRAVPTVRSLISVPAGIKPMPLGRFFLFTALGTALWNALLLLAGTLVGRNLGGLVEVLESYETFILVLLGALAALLLVRRVRTQLARLPSR